MIEPYAHGMLDVGDGNRVYWETSGNPDGKPLVVLHGGPGQGCSERMRAGYHDRYRVVCYDQRGCGRSTPSAADPATDMRVNTTERLIADLELLREHLGIDRWLLRGASWGCTLALAYAQRFPNRVSEIVLSAIMTAAVKKSTGSTAVRLDSFPRSTNGSWPAPATLTVYSPGTTGC